MAHDDKDKEVPTAANSANQVDQAYPRFSDPPGFHPVYSDNAVVMHTDNEFILSFYLSNYGYPHDGIMDGKTGRMQFSDVRPIEARCVSRVIMSPNQMIKLVGALQDNLARHLKKAEQAKEAKESEGAS